MKTSRKLAPQILAEQGSCIIAAAGNSMSPIMYTGDTLHLQRVEPSKLRVGDAVFCKVKGNVFVHLITAIDSKGERWQISNNKNFCNGWTNKRGIYGLCVQVNDKILVSQKELELR